MARVGFIDLFQPFRKERRQHRMFNVTNESENLIVEVEQHEYVYIKMADKETFAHWNDLTEPEQKFFKQYSAHQTGYNTDSLVSILSNHLPPEEP
jgi:hypothetical protein